MLSKSEDERRTLRELYCYGRELRNTPGLPDRVADDALSGPAMLVYDEVRWSWVGVERGKQAVTWEQGARAGVGGGVSAAGLAQKTPLLRAGNAAPCEWCVVLLLMVCLMHFKDVVRFLCQQFVVQSEHDPLLWGVRHVADYASDVDDAYDTDGSYDVDGAVDADPE